MNNQITHKNDGDRMIQIVSPETLRKILKKNGETLKKPKDFGPDDEWIVN